MPDKILISAISQALVIVGPSEAGKLVMPDKKLSSLKRFSFIIKEVSAGNKSKSAKKPDRNLTI